MAFTVETDSGAFEVVADAAEKMGEFYAFFNKSQVSEQVPTGFWRRLTTGESQATLTRDRRTYVQLVKMSEIRRIIVAAEQVSA
jgi:hypothetical protein